MSESENALIQLDDQEKFQVALKSASDEQMAQANKVVRELQAALSAETWRRDEISMAKSNEAWNKEFGQQVKDYERIRSEHWDRLMEASEAQEDRLDWGEYRTECMAWDNEKDDESKYTCFSNCKVVTEDLRIVMNALNDLSRKSEIKRYDLETHKVVAPEIIHPRNSGTRSDPDHGTQECGCGGEMHCSYYDPGGQEMAGAPVFSSYELFQCRECGWVTKGMSHGEYTTDGVDLAGQSLYASMTTREVAEMCVCHDPEYRPGGRPYGDCRNPECIAAEHSEDY